MIAILDYQAGNLTSVELAVRHVGGDCEVTADPSKVAQADRVIFPGVGAAAQCMENLHSYGLGNALKAAVDAGKPVLAICIGVQLLFESSEEDGGVDCLGILPGQVKRFPFAGEAGAKIPQMGWNQIEVKREHPLLSDFEAGDECYFVHSYYVEPADPELVLTETEYAGFTFTSAVSRDNLVATQFHPEKSGRIGLSLLKNFLTWNPV
ncbi:MAG: imidazole glycerol phosphate synthase subunit HisH [Planctomycetota bacterium]